MNTLYLRTELTRMIRNRRFFAFSLGFPLVMFFFIAGANRHAELAGIPFPRYYLAGMTSWGAMTAVLSGLARIAAERSIGWNRQLRTTPLRASTYVSAKVVSGYVMAAVTMVALDAAGLSLGVRIGAVRWLEMTGLVLVGLVPFAALGVLYGHLLSIDSMGPALGGTTAMFAMLGGAWGPFADHGWLLRLVRLLPSFWLVRSGRVGLGAASWSGEAWVVIAAWTAALTWLALWAFRRDTRRA